MDGDCLRTISSINCEIEAKHYVKIDKFYPSSQICHCCGFKNEEIKGFFNKKMDMSKCKNEHDRDVNAAINIRNEGIKYLSI